MKIKFLLLFSFCCFLWMWSQGVFSQVKVTDGTDLDGRKYVEKIIGEIYPADSKELDTLYDIITKYAMLAGSRQNVISKGFTRNDKQQDVDYIYIEVACKDKQTTQDFLDALKTLNAKMKLRRHRCKNSDLTGSSNSPCIEKPQDSFEKEKE